jgi:hypothetical protein
VKRQKYKPKNPNEYKRFKDCTHHEGCLEIGFVSYRNDTDQSVRIEYRCIPHIHQEKPISATDEAKKPQANLYQPMVDHKPWMDMRLYQAGKGR